MGGGGEERCRVIVQFQNCAAQAREFIDFSRSSLGMGMVYDSMFLAIRNLRILLN
jgi:hypothetical protein